LPIFGFSADYGFWNYKRSKLRKEAGMRVSTYSALLLYADFRPVSHFPLSLVSWQEAVSGLVRGRAAVVADACRLRRS
jgi:hypothetical protein